MQQPTVYHEKKVQRVLREFQTRWTVSVRYSCISYHQKPTLDFLQKASSRYAQASSVVTYRWNDFKSSTRKPFRKIDGSKKSSGMAHFTHFSFLTLASHPNNKSCSSTTFLSFFKREYGLNFCHGRKHTILEPTFGGRVFLDKVVRTSHIYHRFRW
jgi:hypothetical protein